MRDDVEIQGTGDEEEVYGPNWPRGHQCPAKRAGHTCSGDHGIVDYDGSVLMTCRTWRCPRCERWHPWCHGVLNDGIGDNRWCNDCKTKAGSGKVSGLTLAQLRGGKR